MAILPPDPIYVLRGNANPVHSLLFRVSPYVEHLYAGTEDGSVRVWDLKKNREILKLSEVSDVCMSLHNMDDECLITQRKGGVFNFWKPNGSSWILGTCLDTKYYGFCRCIYVEKNIFIPLPNSQVGLYSTKTENIECYLDPTKLSESHLGEVMAIKNVVQPSELLLIAYESGDIALWDLNVKDIISWYKIKECPMALEYDNSFRKGVIGSPNDKLEVFEITKSHAINQRSTLTIKNPGTSVIRSRPDSKLFTVGGWDGRLRIFTWKFLRPLAILDQHMETIHDIVYSSCKVETYNSKCLMAAGGKDGHISLYDLYN